MSTDAIVPASWLKPFVAGFRRIAGHHPAAPAHIEIRIIATPGPLGSLRDALHWKRANIERWMQQGFAAASDISIDKCFTR